MSHQSELIAADIKRYLQEHEQKKLLRLLTCGSVDDGKSTLIGRLLHDAKMIYEDQLAHLTRDSEKHGTTGAEIDLALLVDGLQAEREQGITIDVAYRYFSTAKRKFIIADTPGHEQYTRNMATGASTCDLAIILIDARQGVQVQTRRHSFIVCLLGIKHVLVAVNKMDLVDYSQARFEQIQADYLAFAQTLNFRSIQCVPISALLGDNVVSLSEHMPWYSGQPLMSQLEQVEVAADATDKGFRFPVQYVNRPHLNFRGYCGTITSGRVSKGDTITVLPSGKSSRIESLLTWEGEIEHAFAPMAITLTLDDEIDVSRGDLLVHSKATPSESVPITRDISAHLVWMDETPLNTTRAYEFKLASQRQTAQVLRVQHKINVNSMAQEPATTLHLNDIARVDLRLERAIPVDDYQLHKATGAFILVDKMSHRTVAAGMALATTVQTKPPLQLTSESIIHADVWEKRWGQKGQIVCITGGSERAQRTGLYTLEKALFDRGYTAIVLEAQLANEKICHSLCTKGIIVLTNAAMNIQGVQSVVVKDDAANLYSLVEESLVRLIAESNRLIS